MQNRPQLYTFFAACRRLGYFVPRDIRREIGQYCQNPDFPKALDHVAFGDLEAVRAILEEANKKENKMRLKELLLLSGTTMTRCGIVVEDKTLLECALGEGDPDMIELIKPYFLMIDDGEKERESQLERYRPCIEAMEKQQADDDLMWLIEAIKKATRQEVAAELAEGDKYDPNYQSDLRTKLNKFRDKKLDPKVRVIKEPRMHCNYQNLRQAYNVLYANWSELAEWDAVKQAYNYDKCDLFACQVIGFIQLAELPSRERFLCARNQFVAEAEGKKIEVDRSVEFVNSRGSLFPNFDAALVKSHSGFGFVSFASIYGVGGRASVSGGACVGRRLENLCRTKTSNLQNLCSVSQNRNQAVRA